MKRHWQKLSIIRLVCTAFILMALAACGDNNGIDESYYTDNSQILTLTMASPEFFAPLLLEAERVLNRSMNQESGKSFRLELTTYAPDEWELHRQRFNVLQMSGEPFDLFVVDRHPLWHYARNGLLADIYELIDQDPTINRNDFFINALEAFKYRGQLLSIPPRFGATFVGINASLPQTFIDRFSQYETISYISLLNIYRDLKVTHPREYDNLIYATLGIMRPRSLFEFAINDFIDINQGIAHLTDVKFIDFLGAFSYATSHFNNTNRPSIITTSHQYDLMTTPFSSRYIMYNRFNNFMFSTISGGLDPWEALFELDSAPFINYIPITDSRGRLISYNNLGFYSDFLSLAVSPGRNQILAWEFIMYTINIMSCDEIRIGNISCLLLYYINPNTLKTSILMRGFVEQTRRALEQVFEFDMLYNMGLIALINHNEPGA